MTRQPDVRTQPHPIGIRTPRLTSDDPGIFPSVFLDRYFVDAQGMTPDDEVTRIEWRYMDGPR